MTEQDYENFLKKYNNYAQYVNADPERKKADWFPDIIRGGIAKLNDEAIKFATFINADPSKFQSKVDELKGALSFDQSLANSLIGMSQPTATPATTPIAANAPQTPIDTTTTPTAGTPSTTPAAATTASEPNQETLNAAFAKYMGSSYNSNSSMDKGKMETVKNALKKFQEENNKPFDINDSEDLNKMRPIMNAAYQSEEYKKVAGVGTSRASGGQVARRSTAAPRQQAGRQSKPLQLPVVGRGVEQMYVDKGGKFVPATDADYNSGQQLYAQKKKGTFDFLRSPKDRFQKVTRNRVERATRP